MNFGYACINMNLRNSDVWTGRTLRKKTYKNKGLEYVSELVKKNTQDLVRIIEWNEKNNIDFYRMSCNMFPFIDWYEFEQLPKFNAIKNNLSRAGNIAKKYDQRITQHPDHFVKVASKNNEKLVNESISTLEQQSRVFDIMDLSNSVYNSINIHVGGAYGNKKKTMERFCKNYQKMSSSLQKRLTVENDDKSALYTVKDLYNGIYKKVGVPIVFDSLHHKCHEESESFQEDLEIALSTWPDDITPIVHHSNSRKTYEDKSSTKNSHSDYYYTKFDGHGHDMDIMLESKKKEKALLNYKSKFNEEYETQ